MSFPRPDEDKILLNICWGYLGGLITREQFMELMDRVPHSFREILKNGLKKIPKKKKKQRG